MQADQPRPGTWRSPYITGASIDVAGGARRVRARELVPPTAQAFLKVLQAQTWQDGSPGSRMTVCTNAEGGCDVEDRDLRMRCCAGDGGWPVVRGQSRRQGVEMTTTPGRRARDESPTCRAEIGRPSEEVTHCDRVAHGVADRAPPAGTCSRPRAQVGGSGHDALSSWLSGWDGRAQQEGQPWAISGQHGTIRRRNPRARQ